MGSNGCYPKEVWKHHFLSRPEGHTFNILDTEFIRIASGLAAQPSLETPDELILQGSALHVAKIIQNS